MKESYYVINNNICTINYAYVQDGAVCYSDLVKVGVALDSGEIVSFSATGYLMNHHTRSVDYSPISQRRPGLRQPPPDRRGRKPVLCAFQRPKRNAVL